jgi:hypothetical protein
MSLINHGHIQAIQMIRLFAKTRMAEHCKSVVFCSPRSFSLHVSTPQNLTRYLAIKHEVNKMVCERQDLYSTFLLISPSGIPFHSIPLRQLTIHAVYAVRGPLPYFVCVCPTQGTLVHGYAMGVRTCRLPPSLPFRHGSKPSGERKGVAERERRSGREKGRERRRPERSGREEVGCM